MDKKKLMLDILDLVLKVNGGIATRNGKGHPTGFFRYSGHVNMICVSINPDGWYRTSENEEHEALEYEEFMFDFDHPDEELVEEYERLNRYINELKLEEDEHANAVQID